MQSRVPEGLGLGCWEFSDIGSGALDDELSIEIIHSAARLGVRHLDTALSYGNGHSERVIGRAVEGRSEEFFIASKAHATTAGETVAIVKESLKRLGRSFLDLFYIHWPQSGFDLRPMMEALEGLRSRGLIRLVGVSNFGVEEMEQASEAGHIDVHQLCYNLLWRYPERDVIPYCIEHGISLVTYSSIAQGLLSDTERRPEEFPRGDARRNTIYYRADVWPGLEGVVSSMREAAHRRGLPLSTAAIRWVLGRPGVVSSLVGAHSVEQLRSNVAAASSAIDRDVETELGELSEEAMRVVPDVGNIFLYYP